MALILKSLTNQIIYYFLLVSKILCGFWIDTSLLTAQVLQVLRRGFDLSIYKIIKYLNLSHFVQKDDFLSSMEASEPNILNLNCIILITNCYW